MLWFCQLSPPYFFASTPYELVAIASRLAPKQICTYTYLKKPNRTHNSPILMTYLNPPPLLEFYSSSTIIPKTYNFFLGISITKPKSLHPNNNSTIHPHHEASPSLTRSLILLYYFLISVIVSTTAHSTTLVDNLCCHI